MRECEITRDRRDEYDVLHLDGSLDAYSFPKLDQVLSELREHDRIRVVLDCEKLEYISSVALGALIGFTRKARENGGNMKLANMSEKIFNIVELLGFHRILDIHETTEEAAAAL